MSKTFKIEAPGYDGRVIAIWPGRTDGPAAGAYEVARQAATHATGFALAVGRIDNNPDLTAHGKAGPVRAAAMERLGFLRKLGQEATKALEGVNKQRAAMARVPAPDAPTAIYDVAIGQYLRGLDDREAMTFRSAARMGTASERMLEAVARLPFELTGMTRDQQGEMVDVLTATRNPEAWEALQEAAIGWAAAVDAVKDAATFIERGAPLQAGTVKPAISGLDGPYQLEDSKPAWREQFERDTKTAP